MRRRPFRCASVRAVAALAAGAAFGVAPAPAPAQSQIGIVNGWTVSDERGWCSASTVYSPDIHLRLVQDIPANAAELFVWNRAWGWIAQDEGYEVTLSFSNGRVHRDRHARGVRLLMPGDRQINGLRLSFRGGEVVEDVARAATVDLLAGQRRLGSLSLRGTSAVVHRLKACAAQSARRHPSASPRSAAAGAGGAQIARPPVHRSGTLTNDDYPAAAIRAREQGRVAMGLAVNADGLVTGCTLIESSGSAILDSTSCAIARRRFRFTPAVDANGRNVAGTATRTIVWRLPEPDPVPMPKAPEQ